MTVVKLFFSDVVAGTDSYDAKAAEPEVLNSSSQYLCGECESLSLSLSLSLSRWT